jgi:hypothetical protein
MLKRYELHARMALNADADIQRRVYALSDGEAIAEVTADVERALADGALSLTLFEIGQGYERSVRLWLRRGDA